MKTIFALLLLFLVSGSLRAAGYELYFCNRVDSAGRCKGKSTEFKWTGDKLQLTSIVRNASQLDTKKLSYKVFFMKNDREGDLAAELSRQVKSSWNLATKKIYFFKPGYYKVDVYNALNALVVTAFVTITEMEITPAK